MQGPESADNRRLPLVQPHEVLFEGRFLRLVKAGTWEFVQRSNCSGVVTILALTDTQHVLFIEQYRPPVDSYVIEFPAGLVNDQPGAHPETMADAAKRELLEETGYEAGRMDMIFEGPISSGFCSDFAALFLARDLKKTGPGGGDDTESIVVHEVPLREAGRWLDGKRANGTYVTARIFAGLYFLLYHTSGEQA